MVRVLATPTIVSALAIDVFGDGRVNQLHYRIIGDGSPGRRLSLADMINLELHSMPPTSATCKACYHPFSKVISF